MEGKNSKGVDHDNKSGVQRWTDIELGDLFSNQAGAKCTAPNEDILRGSGEENYKLKNKKSPGSPLTPCRLAFCCVGVSERNALDCFLTV